MFVKIIAVNKSNLFRKLFNYCDFFALIICSNISHIS